jgi:hypothetical protein
MSSKVMKQARRILRKELRHQVQTLKFWARAKLAFFILIGRVES